MLAVLYVDDEQSLPEPGKRFQEESGNYEIMLK